MASPRLSPELWYRICQYLSHTRDDIANCRLVIKDVHSVASEFLIPRVVVAKRADTLQHALDVIEHPFFRNHVTEVVYDAGTYRKRLVDDYEAYQRICYKDATRDVVSQDSSRKILVDDYEEYQRICNEDQDSSRNLLVGPKPQESLSQLSQRILKLQGMNRDPTCGIRTFDGWLEYGRRWAEQESIANGHQHFATLQRALTLLPKLKWLIYTDFRHLAKHQEPYLELAWRLFGNIIEPSGLDYSLQLEDGQKELLQVFSIIQETPKACIRGIQIGGHPYEQLNARVDPERNDRAFTHAWNEPAGFPHKLFPPSRRRPRSDNFPSELYGGYGYDIDEVPGVVINDDWILHKFRLLELTNVTYLRLPVRVGRRDHFGDFVRPVDVPNSNLKYFLTHSGTHMTSLKLCAVHADLLGRSYASAGSQDNQDYLAALLEGLHFSQLEQLSLQNWVLSDHPSVTGFFSRHASTLKEIQLSECYVTKDQDVVSLTHCVQQGMSLTSVSLDLHPVSVLKEKTGWDTQLDFESDSNEEATIPGHFDEASGEIGAHQRAAAERTSMLRWSMLELEDLWLDGRPNGLKSSSIEPYPFRLPRHELKKLFEQRRLGETKDSGSNVCQDL